MDMSTLVKESVNCAMNIKTHKCRESQCQSCPVWESLQACSEQLDDWERLEFLRLSRVNLKNELDLERSCNRSTNFLKFMLVLSILGVLWSVVTITKAHAEPAYAYYDYYVNDSVITDKLRSTHNHVYDRDLDGEVDCVDYSITFKQEWDKDMPPDYCQIVRNYRKGFFSSMNHLFIRVKLTEGGKWLYIEPQARYNKRNYRMSDFWGSPKYNPRYNNYGETFYWMSLCKR